MELYQLKTFIAVVAEGTLSKAAERVFISLPGASAQIKALEDELGIRLFERLPKGMSLTAAGERLLREAQTTLEAADRMTQVAVHIRGQICGQAQIGVLTDSLPLRLGDFMVELAKRHPKLDVKIQRDVSGRVVKRVRDGELDGGFALSATLPDGVNAVPLMNVDLAVALPRCGSIATHHLSSEALRELPWIDSVSECALSEATHDVFALLGARPRISFVADSDGALRSMIASGLGAGVLRRSEAEDGVQKGEMEIWPHWSGRTQLYWVSTHSDFALPISAAIHDVVMTVWGGAGFSCDVEAVNPRYNYGSP